MERRLTSEEIVWSLIDLIEAPPDTWDDCSATLSHLIENHSWRAFQAVSKLLLDYGIDLFNILLNNTDEDVRIWKHHPQGKFYVHRPLDSLALKFGGSPTSFATPFNLELALLSLNFVITLLPLKITLLREVVFSYPDVLFAFLIVNLLVIFSEVAPQSFLFGTRFALFFQLYGGVTDLKTTLKIPAPRIQSCRWILPWFEETKINSDVSAIGNPGKTGIGAIARSHSVEVLGVLIKGLGIIPPLYAESDAILESLSWAINNSWTSVWIEADSAAIFAFDSNKALFFGGEDSLPIFLARSHIPWLDVVVDPCAAILVLVVTGLLCIGIKESSFVQAIVTTANICVMAFVIIVGGYLGFKTGWAGYELPNGYFPFGVNGMLSGSATVFFAYIGFDSVASTAEEVKNPQRDLPLGIGVALSICCSLYMLVSVVIVGLVPYYVLDPGTPISSFFTIRLSGKKKGRHNSILSGIFNYDFRFTRNSFQVKNPQRDLPLGIGVSLSICCSLYMLVSVVIVGLVPYYALDPDTPISSAFASHGMQWAVYIITAGAVTALCSTLMGSMLPQPRILMAMSRDGLLPPFFSDVNKRTQVPVKSTIVTGICAAFLAFFMDVSQLAGMVSVGTLLAFTIVAVSILILRYVPPDEVPLPSSLQDSIETVSLPCGTEEIHKENQEDYYRISKDSKFVQGEGEASFEYPLIVKDIEQDNLDEQKRRKIAVWSIAFVCIGVLILTSAASAEYLPSFTRYSICGIGGVFLLCGLTLLSWIDQDDARHSFGHSGGFICPFVPFLPIACILINVYLLINLGTGTWIRVSAWLVVGVFVYIFYGRTHSSLRAAVYVPKAHLDKAYRSSTDFLA
ncbi:hypothetical protein GIB67_010020 [Kingdonia uniflora]|uniref:Cationic amino acid transporter C-terminal domain-containing protein n=1 Tax=Kingdonia uniflora TaxID=39325 RepID=A0A7J7KV42_9MAGN|nr:hypothetical protein GIB67_010020 [Kingdonia uniflora]